MTKVAARYISAPKTVRALNDLASQQIFVLNLKVSCGWIRNESLVEGQGLCEWIASRFRWMTLGNREAQMFLRRHVPFIFNPLEVLRSTKLFFSIRFIKSIWSTRRILFFHLIHEKHPKFNCTSHSMDISKLDSKSQRFSAATQKSRHGHKKGASMGLF